MTPTKPLCLLHVPKCAGSSVREALAHALPAGAMSPKHWDATHLNASLDVRQLSPEARADGVIEPDEIEQLSAYSVVFGHFSLSTLLRITDPASVAIVLREPRARLLSLYAWLRLWDATGWKADPRIEHARRSLDEFLADPAVAAESTDNVLCRMLLHQNPKAQIPPHDFIDRDDVDGLASHAIEAIKTLGFVGIVERAEAMWEGLSSFFGVLLAPARVNVTASLSQAVEVARAKPEISSRTLELLDARTAADSIVYKYALSADGISAQAADSLTAAAFAQGLVGFGNAIGSSASEWRSAARMVNDLIEERYYKDRALRHYADDVQAAGELQVQAELELHRLQQAIRRMEAEMRRTHDELSRAEADRRALVTSASRSDGAPAS